MNITLDKKIGDNLYLQLYNSIKREIINGGLKPGDKLPSYRWVTLKFDINIATVIKAYAMLEDAGIIEIIQGSGCYVKALNAQHFSDSLMVECFNKGQGVSETMTNLASNSPYIDTYPAEQFRQIVQEMSSRELSECFAYGDSRGRTELRVALCNYFEKLHIKTTPDNIQVLGGSQQGLDVIARAIIKKGNLVVVENPGYTVAVNTFLNYGCTVKYVPIMEDGANIDELKKLLATEKVDYFYTMPSFQTPTSVCWSDEKKKELIYLARKYGFMIIEDDCMSELSFDGILKRSIISFGATDCVFCVKSFSKILMPGLRMAALIAPKKYAEKLATCKFYLDISSSELLQKCLAIFIERGMIEEHLKTARKIYESKYLLMKEKIEKSQNISLAHDPKGGLFFWAKLNVDADPFDFYSEMYREGVLLIPGNVYSHTGQHGKYLHLGYCAAEDSSITEAIGKIDKYLCLNSKHYK